MKVCDSVLSYFDRNGSFVSTRRIADQCGRNIIAQKAPVIRANENLKYFIPSLVLTKEGEIEDSVVSKQADFKADVVADVFDVG